MLAESSPEENGVCGECHKVPASVGSSMCEPCEQIRDLNAKIYELQRRLARLSPTADTTKATRRKRTLKLKAKLKQRQLRLNRAKLRD